MSDLKNTVNLLRPFYRGLPIIAVIMALAVMAAKKYLNYTTPMYESVVQIKLADAQIGVPHSNLYRDFDVFASSNKIGAEVEMVKSQVVVTKALKKLDLSFTAYRVGDLHKTELYNDCPFIIIPQKINTSGYDVKYGLTISKDSLVEISTPAKQVIKAKMNSLVSLPNAEFIILKNDSVIKNKPGLLINDRYEFTINSEKKLIDDIKSKLDVIYLDKEVPILRIAFKSAVAEKSADIVNTVSEAYIRDYIEEKYAAADTTVDFLNKEVDNYNNKLTTSEGALEGYRKKNNIINLKQEGETGLRSLAELKNHRAGLQMDLHAIDSLDNYMKQGKEHIADLAPNFQTFNDLLSTELLKKIKSLQSDRHDLLLKYTAENDKVKVVDDKLDDLYSYLQEGIKNTRENLQVKYDDLNSTIAREEAAFASFPTKDRNMTVLERNTSMNEQIFRFLHEKRTDAEIAKAANISFHRIISKGEVPKVPVSPNPGLLKAVAGFLGFLGAVALIYMIHFLKGRVNNETSILKNSDTPLFARIPFLKNKQQSAQVFQKTAIDLQVKNWLDKGSVISITSFGKREGKRTIATGIATGASELGKKILLVDVDGTTDSSGLKDIEVLRLTETNEHWKHPDTLKQLIQSWKEAHDVVIIKNPAASMDPAAFLLMAESTLNLVVLDSRLTRMKRIEETDMLHIELGINNIQFVLNRNGYTPTVFHEAKRMLKLILSWKPLKKFKS